MNSGCYENDISKVLISINIVDIKECKEKEIKREQINFFYRGTDLSNQYIITSIKLRGISQSKDFIEKKQIQMMEKKNYPSQVKLKHVEVLLKTQVREKHGN